MFLNDVLPPGSTSEHNLLTDLTIGQLLAVVATLVVIIGIVRSVNPIMHRLNDMLDDWNGEKQRPGVPGRKGVMERLEDQDEVLSNQDEVLSHLRKKVEPLVDDAAEGNHQEVLHKLDEISSSAHVNAHHLTRVEKLLKRHIRESKQWVQEVDEKAAERDFRVPPWPDLPDEDEDRP